MWQLDDVRLRNIVTRFRLSCHDLQIEKGRWSKLRESERVCQCCDWKKYVPYGAVVEDEKHFIFECSLYYDIRGAFYGDLFTRVAHGDLKDFFEKNDPFVVGKFIDQCMKKRCCFLADTSAPTS
jgi:hypothetical protein